MAELMTVTVDPVNCYRRFELHHYPGFPGGYLLEPPMKKLSGEEKHLPPRVPSLLFVIMSDVFVPHLHCISRVVVVWYTVHMVQLLAILKKQSISKMKT